MCNSLHKNSKKIPKSGIGYKLFRKINNKYVPLTYAAEDTYNEVKDNKTIKWNDKYYYDGFCFFLTKYAGQKAKKWWGHESTVLKKIKYKSGLGKHVQATFNRQEIALCKEFTILKGEFL